MLNTEKQTILCHQVNDFDKTLFLDISDVNSYFIITRKNRKQIGLRTYFDKELLQKAITIAVTNRYIHLANYSAIFKYSVANFCRLMAQRDRVIVVAGGGPPKRHRNHLVRTGPVLSSCHL